MGENQTFRRRGLRGDSISSDDRAAVNAVTERKRSSRIEKGGRIRKGASIRSFPVLLTLPQHRESPTPFGAW